MLYEVQYFMASRLCVCCPSVCDAEVSWSH